MNTGNIDLWNSIVADNIIVKPPWDRLIGREACTLGLKTFFQNYTGTSAKMTRIIYDDTQPFLAVAQQSFSTTNKETGKHGDDNDFVLVEIENGKIKYWRTYFNTGNTDQTVQTTDNTAAQVIFLNQKVC